MNQLWDEIPKKERSPSPVLRQGPQVVTSGSKLVSPLPPQCTRNMPDFVQERKKWAKTEIDKLKRKGLKPGRIFVRDDGLVIDWTSSVPVWSDTLLPATSVDITVDDEIMEIEPPVSRPPNVSSATLQASEELEASAVDFLKRYAKTFDTDRPSLAQAYSSNAMFSCCIHDVIAPGSVAAAFAKPSEAARFASRSTSRNLLKNANARLSIGRAEVLAALMSLGPHKFCSAPPTDIGWNVLHLVSPPYIFLSCHGYLTDNDDRHRLSFDQTFILSKSEIAEEQRVIPGLWPFIAISHQLTVRDFPYWRSFPGGKAS